MKARSYKLKCMVDEFQTGTLLDSNYRFYQIMLNFKGISRMLSLDKCVQGDRTN